MRFVPVKEEHQQIILCLHRTRNRFAEERTATYNRLRGLRSLALFGEALVVKVQGRCGAASRSGSWNDRLDVLAILDT